MALSPNTLKKMQGWLGGGTIPDQTEVPGSGILGDTDNQGGGILDTAIKTPKIGSVPATTGPQADTTPPPSTVTLPGASQLQPQTINTPATPQGTGNLSQANDPSTYAIGGVNYGLPPPQNTVPTDTTGAPTTPAPVAPSTPGILGAPATTTATTNTSINTTPGTPNNVATQLNESQLTNRAIDPNELVANQLTGILDSGGKYLSDARARAIRSANTRGLSNSTLAGTGGEEAAISAAMPIATADAATYGKVSDYNTALKNQAYMYNTDAENNFKKLNLQIGADKEMQERAVAGQLAAAGINAAASGASASANLQAAQLSAETSRLNALLNAQTSKDTNAANNATSIYNQKLSLANNIIQNPDLSPDYKQKLINGLGPDFAFLAAGVFTDGSMDQDLNSGSTGGGNYGGGSPHPNINMNGP